MEHNHDAIRQENRKALPKFLLIFVLSLVLGAAVGWAGTFLVENSLVEPADAAAAVGAFFCVKVAPWLLLVCPVLIPAVSLPFYFSAKGRLSRWDGENDEVQEAVELRLSIALIFPSLVSILSYFLLAAMLAGLWENTHIIQLFGGMAGFLLAMAETIWLQQKTVDLYKRMNPEKKGSVYDPKFQKKWADSCDEAEKAVVGQCAYRAYRAMNYCCLALYLILALAIPFLNTGFLPVLAVCVIWMVGTVSYARWSVKLSRRGKIGL